jgi:hypothetical protein
MTDLEGLSHLEAFTQHDRPWSTGTTEEPPDHGQGEDDLPDARTPDQASPNGVGQ